MILSNFISFIFPFDLSTHPSVSGKNKRRWKSLISKFKDGKYNIWKTNDIAKYPLLRDKAQLYVIAFPSSYLVESGFSRVSHLLSKVRNRLDIVKRGDLRLSLTSMEPDIKKLTEQHQPQGSHWINLHFFSNHTYFKMVYYELFTSVHKCSIVFNCRIIYLH